MKILAFVDSHGSKKAFRAIKKKIKVERPDIIICAGDFTIFETDIKKILNKFSKLKRPLYLIHGNHENEYVVKALSKHYKNIEFIHKKKVTLDDVQIIGYGGGGFNIKDPEFDKWAKKLKFKKNSKKILVVHAPFHKTRLDKLEMGHHGSKSFTSFLKKNHIDLAFCGHFHENAGKEDRIKNTRIINPGPHGKIFHI